VPGAWDHSIGVRTGKGIERVSVRQMIEMQADHVEHHVKRIVAIRAELRES
jgi:hypothetical protein